jgi:hypothetical protein
LENQAKVYIPGYNGNQPAYVADHFATSITAPNRVDLSFNECGGPNYKKMVDYWSANKIKTESINVRFNGGTKIMGKIMGTVIRNGEW